jgi:hypothetical protein
VERQTVSIDSRLAKILSEWTGEPQPISWFSDAWRDTVTRVSRGGSDDDLVASWKQYAEHRAEWFRDPDNLSLRSVPTDVAALKTSLSPWVKTDDKDSLARLQWLWVYATPEGALEQAPWEEQVPMPSAQVAGTDVPLSTLESEPALALLRGEEEEYKTLASPAVQTLALYAEAKRERQQELLQGLSPEQIATNADIFLHDMLPLLQGGLRAPATQEEQGPEQWTLEQVQELGFKTLEEFHANQKRVWETKIWPILEPYAEGKEGPAPSEQQQQDWETTFYETVLRPVLLEQKAKEDELERRLLRAERKSEAVLSKLESLPSRASTTLEEEWEEVPQGLSQAELERWVERHNQRVIETTPELRRILGLEEKPSARKEISSSWSDIRRELEPPEPQRRLSSPLEKESVLQQLAKLLRAPSAPIRTSRTRSPLRIAAQAAARPTAAAAGLAPTTNKAGRVFAFAAPTREDDKKASDIMGLRDEIVKRVQPADQTTAELVRAYVTYMFSLKGMWQPQSRLVTVEVEPQRSDTHYPMLIKRVVLLTSGILPTTAYAQTMETFFLDMYNSDMITGRRYPQFKARMARGAFVWTGSSGARP